MTHGRIAATIAYTLDERGFSLAERLRVAEAFADDLRLRGKSRAKFLADCRKASEDLSSAIERATQVLRSI